MRKSVVGRMLKDRKIHRQPRRSEAFYKRRRDENWSEGAKEKKMEEREKKQNSNCDALSSCIKN